VEDGDANTPENGLPKEEDNSNNNGVSNGKEHTLSEEEKNGNIDATSPFEVDENGKAPVEDDTPPVDDDGAVTNGEAIVEDDTPSVQDDGDATTAPSESSSMIPKSLSSLVHGVVSSIASVVPGSSRETTAPETLVDANEPTPTDSVAPSDSEDNDDTCVYQETHQSEWSGPVYLDCNGTTAIYPAVLEAMMPYFTTHYGNPSSSHYMGQEPKRALTCARQNILTLLGDPQGDPTSIWFTSCGTLMC
jgi:hypothetical protein